jgi:NADH dehydrogenase FAD-containing subunit
MQFSSDSVILNDRELETSTIVWTATPKGNRIFKDSGLAVDERGFAIVDADLRVAGRIFAMGQSVRAAGKQPLGERTGDALIVEGIAVAENIAASVNNKKLTTYTPRVDTVHSVAFGKRQGFGWFGPLFWTGALPVNLRLWHEKRIARAAQNI